MRIARGVRELAVSRALRIVLAVVVAMLAGSAELATAQPAAVVVVKPFGAALRSAPSSDAPIDHVADCGALLTVVGGHAGWFYVYSHASYLWVGSARVADAALAIPTCAGGRTFQMGQVATARVETGCLSLRHSPAREAAYQHCVPSGYQYVVTNGPIEVAGEDWLEVWSEATGSGWVLARYLVG